jgi:putative tryptophan/tyrosine transport system substrate-binding protein
MNRREFIALLGRAGVSLPCGASAQQLNKPRIGVLIIANREPFWSLFKKGLQDLGYIDGKNIQIEFRSAEGKATRLPELAAELVSLKVDIIVASATPSVQAAKQATTEVPIVMAPAGDPVETGLVASLARPGGNVTGLSAVTAEIVGKSLEVIREILPPPRRVAVLANAPDPFTKHFLEQIELSARAIGIDIQTIMIRAAEELDTAFSQIDKKRVDAVIVQPSLQHKRSADLALKYRLPAICPAAGFASAGGLMSYAYSAEELYPRAAGYVDKILKGSKPADLPIEQPGKYKLVINLKTAKALGLAIPQSILLRADEVIE